MLHMSGWVSDIPAVAAAEAATAAAAPATAAAADVAGRVVVLR